MNKLAMLSTGILVLCIAPVQAAESRRATMTGGGGGSGNCSISVEVDGIAELEVRGDTGVLTTLSGRDARWRRFQCNGPLPRDPRDFRVVRISGRGAVRLLQNPGNNGGRALLHINDAKGGRDTYTISLQWRGLGGGGWSPGPPPAPPPGHSPPDTGGHPVGNAIQVCQDSVSNRLNRDGYSRVNFERTVPDNNPGRNDWIVGTASAKRDFRTTWFSFSCSVDSRSGRIRSVDVVRR